MNVNGLIWAISNKRDYEATFLKNNYLRRR